MHSRLLCSKLGKADVNRLGEMDIKFLLYQILAIGIIWLGMAFFYNDLLQSGVIIFYIVSSWLLLLIVLLVKEFLRQRKK